MGELSFPHVREFLEAGLGPQAPWIGDRTLQGIQARASQFPTLITTRNSVLSKAHADMLQIHFRTGIFFDMTLVCEGCPC